MQNKYISKVLLPLQLPLMLMNTEIDKTEATYLFEFCISKCSEFLEDKHRKLHGHDDLYKFLSGYVYRAEFLAYKERPNKYADEVEAFEFATKNIKKRALKDKNYGVFVELYDSCRVLNNIIMTEYNDKIKTKNMTKITQI